VPFLATYAAKMGKIKRKKRQEYKVAKLYYKRAEALEGAEPKR
jgi:hypothetical protein